MHQSDSNNAALYRLWDATPASWRNTLPSPVSPPADWTSAVATIISRLGRERGVRTQLPISETTIRSTTRMQLGTFWRNRHCHVLQYATSALQGTLADTARTAATATNTLLIDMADLWRLPWDPRHKESLWRLVNHGITGASGHNNPSSRPCMRAWIPPARGTRGDMAFRQTAGGGMPSGTAPSPCQCARRSMPASPLPPVTCHL